MKQPHYLLEKNCLRGATFGGLQKKVYLCIRNRVGVHLYLCADALLLFCPCVFGLSTAHYGRRSTPVLLSQRSCATSVALWCHSANASVMPHQHPIVAEKALFFHQIVPFDLFPQQPTFHSPNSIVGRFSANRRCQKRGLSPPESLCLHYLRKCEFNKQVQIYNK